MLTLADLQFLAEKNPQPVGIDADGVLLHANEHLARMLRVTDRHALEGRALMERVEPNHREAFASRLERLRQGDEQAKTFETRLTCTGGTAVDVEIASTPLDIDGRVIVMSSIRDIGARKRAEAKQRDQASAFEAAQRFASFGMWTEEPDRGRAPEWSEQTFRIFGVDPKSFIYSRERLFSIIHPEDLDAVIEARQRFLDGGEGFESEYRVIHPGGEVRWVRALGGMDAASDGSRRVIGVAQDVTKRRAFEAQLARSQKMEAINRLAGGIAHDFNNLLMVMMGQVSLAQRRLAQPELVSTTLDELNLAIERAASLTQQLLTFARRQASRQEVLDFAAVLRDVESLITRIIGEDVVLELTIPDTPVSVRADRSQLEQLVFNLVVNARDAMPEGGRLSIRLSEERLPNAPAEAANALLEVRDAGSGIPPDIRDHIFEPFFTTKPVGQGSGLGLSTVYAIVEQANGRIEVESEPGQRGSAFCVRWPLTHAPITPRVSSTQSGVEERVAHGEILLVEDDAQVRAVLTIALGDLGYVVHAAESADRALECLRGPGRGAGVLITDVVMPGASGPVLVRRARAIVPLLPVVLLSGYTADHVDAELLLDSTVRFLPKPVSIGDLARTLEVLLRGKA